MTPEPPAGGRTHIDYFDAIRLTAAFGVVFMHTASGPLWQQVNTHWLLLNPFVSLAFTSVPLFLMMSGYLSLNARRAMDIRYLFSRRLPRLLVPLAFWTVMAVADTLVSRRAFTVQAFFAALLDALRSPAAMHLWYMYLLTALTLLSPFLSGGVRALDESGHRRYALVLIGAVMAQSMLRILLPGEQWKFLDVHLIYSLSIYSGDLCVFLLGYYLSTTRRKLPNWLLVLAGLILLGAVTVGTYLRTVETGGYEQSFQNQSGGFEVALAACVFLLWKQCFRGKLPQVLRPVVALTLPIYMMHGVVLSVLMHLNIFARGLFDTVGFSVLVFLGCFFCVKTAASVKPCCFLITGLRYEEACGSCNWQYTLRVLRERRQGASGSTD